MARKKKETARKVMGIYPVERCRICGAEIFWMKCEGKRLPMDVEPVPWVEPIPGCPVGTVYGLSGFSYPAVIGEDIPDTVENVHWNNVRHECRGKQAAGDEYVQEELPWE
jgi:hypothetical protein